MVEQRAFTFGPAIGIEIKNRVDKNVVSISCNSKLQLGPNGRNRKATASAHKH